MHYLDYSEQIQHGTPDFPLAYYYVDEKHPRYQMPMHWHRETELLHIARGSLKLYADNNVLTLRAGDILQISEGTLHGGEPENCVYECVVFDAKALLQTNEGCKRALRGMFERSVHLESGVIRGNPALNLAAETLYAAARRGTEKNELALMGALYGFFGALSAAGGSGEIAGARSVSHQKAELLKPALEHIETHYQQHITLETLARLSGMSPKYFCRYFRAIVHRSPIDYLNYYRIECACTYLVSTDMTVAEIAYHCGFSDSSFFIRSFKKYRGVTPRQYRLGEGREAGSENS